MQTTDQQQPTNVLLVLVGFIHLCLDPCMVFEQYILEQISKNGSSVVG
jgi:hypothetical protein